MGTTNSAKAAGLSLMKTIKQTLAHNAEHSSYQRAQRGHTLPPCQEQPGLPAYVTGTAFSKNKKPAQARAVATDPVAIFFSPLLTARGRRYIFLLLL